MAFVAVLFTCTLFFGCTSTLEVDFFYPMKKADRNLIRLQCISGGDVDLNARFEFYNSMNVLIRNQLTDIGDDSLLYKITETVYIRCVIGEQHSANVTFTAIPTVSNDTISIDIYRSMPTKQICPIPVPNIHSLVVYIIWEQILDGVPMPLMNNSEFSYMLSHDNRSLSLLSNSADQRVLRCTVRLQQCSGFNNLQRCEYNDISGSFMKFHVLERSEITLPPSSQVVTHGESATFKCNAEGSYISMRWIFNGSTCDDNGCEHNGVIVNMTRSLDVNNSKINSTLEIRTGKLHSVIMEKKNYTCQCIVEQNLNSSSLKGHDINETAILTVHPQRASKFSSERIAAIVIPLVIITITIIVVVASFCYWYFSKGRKIKKVINHPEEDKPIDKPHESGPEVVDSCIEKLNSPVLGMLDDNNFLRRVAYVMSDFGRNMKGGRGIWQLPYMAFEDTMDTRAHARLPHKYERIWDAYGIDWKSVKYKDLDEPFYSALAARLYLSNFPKHIPPADQVNEQAKYWKFQYMQGKGDFQNFLNKVSELEKNC